jgi:dipeptidase E
MKLLLTALPSIEEENWVPKLQETDALLVGGGDCQYLCYWMQQSGVAELLPSLLRKTVYVGVSAGSMIMTRFGTTYGGHTLPDDSDNALGLVDFCAASAPRSRAVPAEFLGEPGKVGRRDTGAELRD